MPQLAANQPPPPDYYAENLRQVLGHVCTHYGDLLHAEEHAFAARLLATSTAAQRLFARLIGRKGPWIRIDKLRYAEVPHIEAALEALCAARLIAVNPPAPADALLGLLTNAERAELFPAVMPKQAAPKAHWIACCVARYSDAFLNEKIAAEYPWVYVRDYALFTLYQLLFFGDPQQDLTAFVLQDLGLLSYENYQLSVAQRQFTERAQLDRYLQLQSLNALSHRTDELPVLAERVAAQLWLDAESRLEQRVKDRTLNRLGRWHERRGEYDAALACYARSTSHPARERSTRLLQRLGDTTGVERMLCQMRNDPRCAEEEDFAERFGRRRRTAGIPTTVYPLDGVVPAKIEQHAIEVLTADGGRGWHLENRLSMGITGLVFWPVIFADVPGAFVNPFQTGPVDLRWPDFLEPRRDAMRARLEALQGECRFVDVVASTWREKHGVANRFVSWGHFDEVLLDALLAAIPAAHLLRLSVFVLENLYRLRSGFPDLLLVYGPGEYEFVEVKGPTDQLLPGQRMWFRALRQLELPARVAKFKA